MQTRFKCDNREPRKIGRADSLGKFPVPRCGPKPKKTRMNDGNQWQPSAANPAENEHRDEDGDGVRGADEQLPGAPDDSKLDHRDRDGRRYQRAAQGPTLDDSRSSLGPGPGLGLGLGLV